MDGILDGDVGLGRLTHEEAGKLKEQVLLFVRAEKCVGKLPGNCFRPRVRSSHSRPHKSQEVLFVKSMTASSSYVDPDPF